MPATAAAPSSMPIRKRPGRGWRARDGRAERDRSARRRAVRESATARFNSDAAASGPRGRAVIAPGTPPTTRTTVTKPHSAIGRSATTSAAFGAIARPRARTEIAQTSSASPSVTRTIATGRGEPAPIARWIRPAPSPVRAVTLLSVSGITPEPCGANVSLCPPSVRRQAARWRCRGGGSGLLCSAQGC